MEAPLGASLIKKLGELISSGFGFMTAVRNWMKKPENNATKWDLFRYELYYAIKDEYQEKVVDKIVNSIFDEVILNREGKINSLEFRKIVENIIPDSNKKVQVVETLARHFDICINKYRLMSDEHGSGIIPESNHFESEMQELKSAGKCKYCSMGIAGWDMARHLSACDKRAKANSRAGNEKIFLIKAGAGLFWVYFEANASDTLKKIDGFLRDLWLECCGHLSAFHVGGITYSDEIEDSEDESMKIAIGKILSPGISFSHEYDFGTTTELDLKCLSERTGGKIKEIQIIAGNDMPDFRCKCGKQAKDVCPQCVFDIGPEALLCSKCGKKHDCGEEMLLPVVNSPRMGMCGYTGE